MGQTNYQFVVSANPHSWFLVGDDLHSQVALLRKYRGSGEMEVIDYDKKTSVILDETNRATFLLASLVLENLLKSFLVYENPDWISNGRLSNNLRTHSLTKLADMSSLAPYKRQSMKTLAIFENGNESWARYPCALNGNATEDPLVFTEEIWKKYNWLIAAYAKRLKLLLSKIWKGPHGFEGRYKINGLFLGVQF